MRVSEETKQKVKEVLLDEENQGHLGKCTLCNQTLLHLCKSTEVLADAPMATVLGEITKIVNDSALPSDQVTVDQLKGRVKRLEGEGGKLKRSKRPDKPEETDSVTEKTSRDGRPTKITKDQIISTLQQQNGEFRDALEEARETITRLEAKIEQYEQRNAALAAKLHDAGIPYSECLCRDKTMTS